MTTSDPMQAAKKMLKMLRVAALCAIGVIPACQPNALHSAQDGEALIQGIVRPGRSLKEVEEALTNSKIEFSEIAAGECGDAGDVWMDPRCVCAGCPALWLYLSEDARPYNPFENPTINAFLAFDEPGTLKSMTVIVLDGDE